MDEIVGCLNHEGDIRATMEPRVMETVKYGPVLPAAVEYDEVCDVTTVGFVSLVTAQALLAAEDPTPSLLDAAKAVR